MSFILFPTLLDYSLTDFAEPTAIVSTSDAEKLFTFFRSSNIFNWKDVHNNCEARADAVCIILNQWKIPHYKGWVFSGAFLKNHIGGLKQNWNYHVAALIQVQEQEKIIQYVIDPSTANTLKTLEDWAANITAYPHSYHVVKLPEYYIFNGKGITKNNWHKRNKQNYKWTIQGLAGINGLSAKGKCQLCFNKKKIVATKNKLKRVMLSPINL